MKKFLTAIAVVIMAAVTFVCGCVSDGRDGRDGTDGHNVTINEVYREYVERNGEISFEDFLKEYLSFSGGDLQNAAGFKATVNKSLMSGVSILSRFSYGDSQSIIPGLSSSSRRTYKVYTGSGVIIKLDKVNGDALVVTNCHVVYDDTAINEFCTDVRLYLYGQDESGVNFSVDDYGNISKDENYKINAEVIGVSKSYDIALLKVSGSEIIKRSDAVAASFSDRTDVYAGEHVYTVGNASGEGMSASDGIISKDSENIILCLSEKNNPSDSDYYQYRVMRTTAAINHGNSGGALYNVNGEIIGIVNSKDDSADVDNMGYVLPANNVRRLVELMYDSYVANGNKMKSGGGVDKAYLNVQTFVTDTYSRFNESLGTAEIIETIRIEDVLGEPARGKIEKNDVLKSVKLVSEGTVKEELKITRRYHLNELMLSVRKGDTVVITVERGGIETEISIVFDSDAYFKNHIS